jgi:hypothetical protein
MPLPPTSLTVVNALNVAAQGCSAPLYLPLLHCIAASFGDGTVHVAAVANFSDYNNLKARLGFATPGRAPYLK